MTRTEAEDAARASGLTAQSAGVLVMIAAELGTATGANGVLVVCAAGDYAVETLDDVPARRVTR